MNVNDESTRILMIEDSEEDAMLIVNELKKDGYNPVYERVETASSMKEALSKKHWDIILCDFSLPKFNAPSAINILKENNIDIPLIIMAGTIEEYVSAECMRIGARDYVMKNNLTRLCPMIARELKNSEVKSRTKQAESQREAVIEALTQNISELKQEETKLQETIEHLKKAIDASMQVIVSIVETRDPFTLGHQLRSTNMACAIADEMKLSQNEKDAIKMAGAIYDIGKLTIPAEILSKFSRLTDVEISMIKGHPKSGYEMLKDLETPWPLAEIVYQHHERMNGSGYPRNLSGEEILMESRILGVTDVLESMTSKRSYRPALGMDVALEEIERNKGILYDRDVVDSCLKIFRGKEH